MKYHRFFKQNEKQKEKKSLNFGKFRQSLNVYVHFRLQFSHNYVWIAYKYVCDFRFNSCNLFKICLISFYFVYISFCQLYTRKPRSIYVQLHKSARTYSLSRFLLH